IGKAKEEIATESAKIELETTQLRIKKEEELVQVQYEQGLLAIKEYLAKKADLDLQDHNAKLKQLKAEFDAKMQYMDIEGSETRQLAEMRKEQADLDAQTQLASLTRQREEISLRLQEDVAKKVITPGEAGKYGQDLGRQFDVLSALVTKSQAAAHKQATAETVDLDAKELVAKKKYYADVLKENENYQQKGRQLTEQDIKDEIAARQKLSDEIQKVDKSRVELAKENTEFKFQQGEIGAQEYLEKRVQYVEDEYKAVKD